MATFVLVHESSHGGWCWKRVSPLLSEDGHEAYTPTLTGLGERSHLVSKDIGMHYRQNRDLVSQQILNA